MQRLREHAFFGLPIVTTFSLGVWQVYRLDRKKGLIAERSARLRAPPLTVRDLYLSQNTSSTENRRVEFSGTFLHDKEMLVGPRSAPQDLPASVLQWSGSSGFLVVTPLLPDSQARAPLLVVRGWVPQRLAKGSSRDTAPMAPGQFVGSLHTQDGDNHISTGVVRAPVEERNRFTPDNDAGSGDWYFIDAEAMLPESDQRPTIVELVQPVPGNGWPYPKTEASFLEFRTPPSTHVIYAATWFSLSAALALLTRARYRRAARIRNSKTPHPL